MADDLLATIEQELADRDRAANKVGTWLDPRYDQYEGLARQFVGEGEGPGADEFAARSQLQSINPRDRGFFLDVVADVEEPSKRGVVGTAVEQTRRTARSIASTTRHLVFELIPKAIDAVFSLPVTGTLPMTTPSEQTPQPQQPTAYDNFVEEQRFIRQAERVRQGVDPAAGENGFSRAMYGAVAQGPDILMSAAVAFVTGGAALPAVTAYWASRLSADEHDRMIQAGVPEGRAAVAALVSGTAQGVIETTVGRFLPIGFVQKSKALVGPAVANKFIRAGIEVGKELSEEALQPLTSIAVREAMDQAGGTDNVDWRQEIVDNAKQFPETALTVAALMGGAAVVHKGIELADQKDTSRRAFQRLGIKSRSQQDRAFMKAVADELAEPSPPVDQKTPIAVHPEVLDTSQMPPKVADTATPLPTREEVTPSEEEVETKTDAQAEAQAGEASAGQVLADVPVPPDAGVKATTLAPAAPVAEAAAPQVRWRKKGAKNWEQGELVGPAEQEGFSTVRLEDGGTATVKDTLFEKKPEVAATGEQAIQQAEDEADDATSVGGPRSTSIKNAIVDQEREKRGLPPAMQAARRSFEDVWDEAMRVADETPQRQDALIRELKDKPRAITDLEDALLLQRQVVLQNEYDKTLDRFDEARSTQDDAAIAQIQTDEELLSSQLLELYDVNKSAGTETGRGLNARRMMANEDFTLAKMLAQKRSAIGGELTPEASAEVKAASAKIADLEKRLAEHQAQIETLESEKAAAEAIKDIPKTVARQRSSRSVAARANVEEAWKEFLAESSGKLFSIGGQFESIPSAIRLAKAYIELGVAKFGDFYDAVKARIGEEKARKAGDVLARAWSEAIVAAVPQPRGELKEAAAIGSHAKELAEFFVSTGISERNELIDAVHAELKTVLPEITRRQTMDAISGYGDFRPLDKDAIKVTLRDLKGQMQQVGKLEDMQAGQAPVKTGPERRIPSDEERRLIQQVNEAKKRGGFNVTDPATQLRSAMQAVKARLTHQIADLEQQIETRQRIVRKKGVVELDAEARELAKIRDALKKDFDEIFGQADDAQRIAAAVKAAERSIAEYERRIKDRDIATKKKAEGPTSPKLEALRARRDALKDELHELRDAVNPKKTPEERALSAYKARTRTRIAEHQERLATEDFAPRVRKETKLDDEGERLRFEAEKAKADFLRGLEADRRRNRTLVQKIFGAIPETLNTARAVLTSMDFSAVLRQGGFIVMAHPIRGARALGTMFRAGWSEAEASKAANEITQRPNASLYRRAGLSLTGIHGRLSQQEEAYMSRWAKKIPLVAGSERAYVAFLNRLRVDSFDALAASLGRNGSVSEAEAKVIANFVNAATGRGGLGRFNAAAVPMATVFFAPKYVVSRFQLLLGQPLYKGSARTRLTVAKEYGRALTGLGVFYGLSYLALSALLGEPDKKTWGVELDPRSSDFAKIRIGPTRIDPLFGLQQATVLISRLVSGETKTLKGKVVSIRGKKVPFGVANSADVIARFLRAKLSPIIGAVVNLVTGRNVIGEPTTPLTVVRDLTIPLSMREIYDSMKAQGVPAGIALGLLNIFGVSVQTYDIKPAKRKGGEAKSSR